MATGKRPYHVGLACKLIVGFLQRLFLEFQTSVLDFVLPMLCSFDMGSNTMPFGRDKGCTWLEEVYNYINIKTLINEDQTWHRRRRTLTQSVSALMGA